MKRPDSLSLTLTHAVGGCAVGACLLAFTWLTFLRSEGTVDEIKAMQRSLQSAGRDEVKLRGERDRLRELLRQRQEKLQSRGKLPAQAPVEAYFGALSNLAARHQLRVHKHHPLGQRSYPGLLELRYAYEVSGRTSDLMAFLLAIEDTPFWADVSYLKIEGGPPSGADRGTRTARLTISMFANREPEPEVERSVIPVRSRVP